MTKALVNTYEINFWNIGDRMCSPVDYFAFAPPLEFHSIGTPARQSKHWLEREYDLLVGGGGLLYQGFRDTLELMLSGASRSIFWGGGFNTHGGDELEGDSKLLSGIDLVGVRDYGVPFRWVPCVSCMHDYFDKQIERNSDVVIYEHQDYPIEISGGVGFARMDNRESDFSKVIHFLGSAESVITSSYHGAYWATLLGCKVVVTNSFSSKFKRFRHTPVISSSGDVFNSLKQARKYPDALLECRAANNEFARDVEKLLHAAPSKSIKKTVNTPLKRAIRRGRSVAKESLIQLRSDITIDDDGTGVSSLNMGKAFYGSRFLDAKFVLKTDRPLLYRGVFPGLMRKKSKSGAYSLMNLISRRTSPADLVRELDQRSVVTGKLGRRIKRVACHEEVTVSSDQDDSADERVLVMTEVSPSDEFVTNLVRLFKGELIFFGTEHSKLSSTKVIDLRGRIYFDQAMRILRSSSVIIAESGFYEEVAKRESSMHLGELKDGADTHYHLWIRGGDKTLPADLLEALSLVISGE